MKNHPGYSHRFLVRAVLTALALAALPALAREADGQQWRKDPASQCAFVAPRSLGTAPVFWTGECKAGKAEGKGMLRARQGSIAGPAFFGELRGGVPVMGAVDLDGGYRAGRFMDSDIGTEDGDRQTSDDAIALAMGVARSISETFASAGNAASAKHYADVAARFEQQLQAD